MGEHPSVFYLSSRDDLPAVYSAIQSIIPRPLIVLVGGASEVDDRHHDACIRAIHIIATTVENTGALVLDGGTHSGVMAAMGRIREERGSRFPLIGITVASLVTFSNSHLEASKTLLDPNHSHFILVPGLRWGDESPWIAEIATRFSFPHPSVTVLVNGGPLAQHEIELSLIHRRPVVILRGTGRLADEWTPLNEKITKQVHLVDLDAKNPTVLEFLKQSLQASLNTSP